MKMVPNRSLIVCVDSTIDPAMRERRLRRAWDNAMDSADGNRVVVATASEELAKVVGQWTTNIVPVPEELNATERAIRAWEKEAEGRTHPYLDFRWIVVLSSEAHDVSGAAIDRLTSDGHKGGAALRILLDRLQEGDQYDQGKIKVVLNDGRGNRCLWFSRHPLHGAEWRCAGVCAIASSLEDVGSCSRFGDEACEPQAWIAAGLAVEGVTRC